MQNKYNKIMIKKYMEKIILNIKTPATLATTSMEVGGGCHTLGIKRLFHRIGLSDITTLLWPVIAMNKRNMTGRTCHVDTILISPFDNCNNRGCNGAVISARGRA